MAKFSTSRFHVEYGPEALFERVLFKMKDVNELRLHSKHFTDRYKERGISSNVLDQLLNFRIEEWSVVTVEVRNDKGKFVNSTWEKIIDGERYWITIGFNNVIQTIVRKNSRGLEKAIRDGEIYDFVAKVNKELMELERLEELTLK